MKSAHGALLDPRTGLVHDLTTDLRRSTSPLSSDENDNTLSHNQNDKLGSRLNTEPSANHLGNHSSTAMKNPDDAPNNNMKSSSKPVAQSFFEAFIPPKYHHVENNSFDDYISDDDNLNFVLDDHVAELLQDSTDFKGMERGRRDKSRDAARTAPPIKTSSTLISNHRLTYGLEDDKTHFVARLGLVSKKRNFTNRIENPVNKAYQLGGLTMQELQSFNHKRSFGLMEKVDAYFACATYKESAEGKAERTKLKKKGQSLA